MYDKKMLKNQKKINKQKRLLNKMGCQKKKFKFTLGWVFLFKI